MASEFSSDAITLKGFEKNSEIHSYLQKQYSCKDCCALSDDFCTWKDFNAWEHLCVCAKQLKIQLSMGHAIIHRELLLPTNGITSGNYEWEIFHCTTEDPKEQGGEKIPSYTCAEKGWTWPLHLKTYIPLLTAQTYEKHTDFMLFKGWRFCTGKITSSWLRQKQQTISKSNSFKTQALEPGRCFLKLGCKGQQEGKRQYGKCYSLLRDAKYKNFIMYRNSRIDSHFLY